MSSRKGHRWADYWGSESRKRKTALKRRSEEVKMLLEALGIEYTFSSPWEYPDNALRVPRSVTFAAETTPRTVIELERLYDQDLAKYRIECGSRRQSLSFDELAQLLTGLL